MFLFEVSDDAQFLGMGEKGLGRIELSGVRTKFWNTDVWSDFHWSQWKDHPVDPTYFSTPYVAVRTGGKWVGFLLHNPGVTFMETPGTDRTRVFAEWQRTSRHLILGSENGEPSLWIFTSDDLAGLTRKLQGLVGKTPLPPLWSLGYHQSRWGYGGQKDILELDRQFAKHGIPCTAVWLDLDYMDGARVFQVAPKQFPGGVEATVSRLDSRRRIVPILDPGVKRENGYRVYDDGHAKDVFCHNSEGSEFVGIVWPGETVFPDFTLASAREWWSGYAKEFRQSGFGAAWVDMNDPSTGPVDPTEMLFNRGKEPHALHRNQYALGMQMATREGFMLAEPGERPFILSRSGSTGTSRYSAVWTGDNVSNEFYLRQCVPTTLGMSLSGIPFNGPDVGGFGGDADDELMVRWMQACLLFPFFRNHSTLESRREEPWHYAASTRKQLAHAIRLRHRFLPYLYQLFIGQEELGDPIVRPLIYDFDDPALASVNDEFMVGPFVLHAPVLGVGQTDRNVILPGSDPWYNLSTGKWLPPGEHRLGVPLGSSPLFLRSGAVVPIQPELPTDNRVDLANPVLLVAVPPSWIGETQAEYCADDGLTFDYRKGVRSKGTVSVSGATARWDQTQSGFGSLHPVIAWPVGSPVEVVGSSGPSEKLDLQFLGRALKWEATTLSR